MKRNPFFPLLTLFTGMMCITACSDNNSNTATSWTITIADTIHNDTTRTLTDAGRWMLNSWDVGQTVFVTSTNLSTYYGKLTAQQAGLVTTLYGTVSDEAAKLKVGDSLLISGPSSVYKEGVGLVYDFSEQDGLLSTIEKRYAYNNEKVAVKEIDATNKLIKTTSSKFVHQQSMMGITFYDKYSAQAINVKSIVFSSQSGRLIQKEIVGGEKTYGDIKVILATPTTSKVYICFKTDNFDLDAYTLTVTDNNGTKWSVSSRAVLANNVYYPLKVPVKEIEEE